ncbi:DEAD/DEAH box helicase [Pelagibaculum spongiae]|uniref:Helicase SNF2 n=1 Tax=Pelagibaculum spongiae TaxID=2080658 RepID=A0A2V1H3Y2_9GAMM|nr:DEAD/DEAH box helicase [Pelagibaculum spongiae]PVZ70356.1 hypothetical protein DC094_07110 [Pelagibaculum spongiae]
MRPLSVEELYDFFDPDEIKRGMSYYSDRRVREVDFAGNRVRGRVRGSARQAYRVVATIAEKEDGDLHIESRCSCTHKENCQHGVALVMEAQRLKGHDPEKADSRDHLDHTLKTWFQELDKSMQPEPDLWPDNVKERLLYGLSLSPGIRRLNVTLAVGRLLSSCQLSDSEPRPFQAENVFRGKSPARFLVESDLSICRRIVANESSLLQGEEGYELLRAMLRTGRCYWIEWGHMFPLSLGSDEALNLAWDVDDQCRQHLKLAGNRTALPVTPACYLEPEHSQIGVIESDIEESMLTSLLSMPPVPADQIQSFQKRWTKLAREFRLPRPKALEYSEVAAIEPKPIMKFVLQAVPTYDWQTETAWEQPAIKLFFDYDGHLIDAGNAKKEMTVFQQERQVHIHRHLELEKDWLARLTKSSVRAVTAVYGNRPLNNSYAPTGEKGLSQENLWLGYLQQELPELQKQGFNIEFTEDFPWRLHNGEDSTWILDVAKYDNDWLSFAVKIQIDGEQIDLLPAIMGLIEEMGDDITKITPDQTLQLPLEDGRRMPLAANLILPLLTSLMEIFQEKDLEKGRIKISQAAAPTLLEVEAALSRVCRTTWQGDVDVQKQIMQWDNEQKKTVNIPNQFLADLRPYQYKGLQWMQLLRRLGYGGILADDMGLGKTIQTLAYLSVEKRSRRLVNPALVLAPTSLVSNWAREADKFTPNLKILVLHGPDRDWMYEHIPNVDVIITTYHLLVRDSEELLKQHYSNVILDEAQAIKNPRARWSQTVRSISADQRFCLTGTPMENHLGELWSQFDFLLPGFLGKQSHFRTLFQVPIEKHGVESRQKMLSKRIRPFMMRRTKEQVAPELPPKTITIQTVRMEQQQAELYESVRMAMLGKVRKEIDKKGIGASRMMILDALLKMRQTCCDPRLLSLDAAKDVEESAKLTLLMEMLENLRVEGRKVLIFSQFAKMLGLIEEKLIEKEYSYSKLTGQTRKRQEQIDAFQDGEKDVFLISLKAGGVGLNLTAADTVIHFDPWWNPAVENQATDRAHRIGQDKPVFVYKLIVEGSLEERIIEMQEKKQALAEAIYAETAVAGSTITEEDIEMLFSPLAES